LPLSIAISAEAPLAISRNGEKSFSISGRFNPGSLFEILVDGALIDTAVYNGEALPFAAVAADTIGRSEGASVSIAVRLKDASGEELLSNALQLTVGSPLTVVPLVPTGTANAPTIAVNSLTAGTSFLEHAALTIAGTVADADGDAGRVRVLIGATELTGADVAPNGTFSTQVYLPNVTEFTPVTVSVYAVDAAGNVSEPNRTAINLVNDSEKPIVAGILADAAQTAVLAGVDLHLRPSVTDNVGIALLVTQVSLDGTVVRTIVNRYRHNASSREQAIGQRIDPVTMMGRSLVVTTTATDFAGNSTVATAKVDVLSVYHLAQSKAGRPLPGVITQLAQSGGTLFGVFTLARNATVSESFVFSADEPAGGELVVRDVIATESVISSLIAHAGQLYAFTEDRSLLRVDIANPAALALVGITDVPAAFTSVASMSDGLVAAGEGKLAVFDLSRHDNPVLEKIASIACQSVEARGALIYASNASNVQVLNRHLETIKTYAALGAADLLLQREGLAVASGSSVRNVVDGFGLATRVDNQLLVGPAWNTLSPVHGIAALDLRLLIAATSQGVEFARASGQAGWGRVASTAQPAAAREVVSGRLGRYYVRHDAGYLSWLDVDASGANLPSSAAVSLTGEALDVEIVGSLAIVAKGQNGLSLVDLGRPESPKLIRNVTTPGSVVSLAHRGNRLYLGLGGAGILQTSISQLGTAVTGVPVAVQGGVQKVIAADSSLVAMGGGVAVLDPVSLAVLSPITMAGAVRDVSASGSLLAVATAAHGVKVFDLSDPTHPIVVATIAAPAGEITTVYLTGGSLYLGRWDPSRPQPAFIEQYGDGTVALDQFVRQLNASPLPSKINALGRWGNRIVAACGNAGVILIDAVNGAVTQLDSPDFALSTESAETALFVADSFGGMQAFYRDPAADSPALEVDAPAQRFDIAKGGERLISFAASSLAGVSRVSVAVAGAPAVVFNEPPFAYNLRVPANAPPGSLIEVNASVETISGVQRALSHPIVARVVEAGSGDIVAPTVVLGALPASVAEGGVLHLTATASDAGSIPSVSFFVDGVLVAVDSSYPYAADVNVPSIEGSRPVTVRAQVEDGAGNVGFDERVIAATDDAAAPAVPVFIAPSPTGARPVVEATTLVLRASASDAVAVWKVQLMVNGALYAESTSSPYDFQFPLPLVSGDTPLVLSLVAWDYAGHSTPSAPLNLTIVKYQPPTVAIASIVPVRNFVEGTQINVTVNAASVIGVAEVDLFLGEENETAVATRPGNEAGVYAFTVVLPQIEGLSEELELHARVRDLRLVETMSAPASVTVVEDKPPTGSLLVVPAGSDFYEKTNV
ncbi:MAG TPA: Ig-like domain-containing protein, partial [Opitutus sp.]|nr:Ig-like domain-containing protein [Opitutus sp.]